MWKSFDGASDEVLLEDPPGLESEQERLFIGFGGFALQAVAASDSARIQESQEPNPPDKRDARC
jgi:hypothetical protein